MVFPSPLQGDGVWQWESRRGGPETGFIKEQASLEESLACIDWHDVTAGRQWAQTDAARAQARCAPSQRAGLLSCGFFTAVLSLSLKDIAAHGDPETHRSRSTKARLDPAQ